MRGMLHLLSLLVLTIFASQAWPVRAVPATPYEYDASIKYTSVENTELGHQNYAYDNIGNLQYYGVEAITTSQDEKAKIGSFFAFVDGLFVTKGVGNIATAPKLAAGLRLQSARSPFKANGTLTDDAIANSRKIIDASEIGDRAIPRGFSKFSTQTFQSPSGDFQSRFLRNENTGEVLFNNPNFKTIFNRTSGQK